MSALLQLYLQSRPKIWLQWIRQKQLQEETEYFYVLGFSATYIRGLTVTYSHTAIILSLLQQPYSSYLRVNYVSLKQGGRQDDTLIIALCVEPCWTDILRNTQWQ